ncbi:MAG: hypothetical protein M3O36_08455 [Myxococcota bacterium]|nr:hypothetical protein [Myxococcota bacterium]
MPFAAVALSAREAVPYLGDLTARRIASVGAALRGVLAVPHADEGRLDEPAPLAVVQPPVGTGTAAFRLRPSSRSPSMAPPSLVLAADHLSRLTAAQLGRVRAVDAVDGYGRPIGVRLSGVQALGLGLREGDVVVSLDGHPTPTLDDGTAAATSALGSGRHDAHAAILRDGQMVAVTVQLPRAAASDL